MVSVPWDFACIICNVFVSSHTGTSLQVILVRFVFLFKRQISLFGARFQSLCPSSTRFHWLTENVVPLPCGHSPALDTSHVLFFPGLNLTPLAPGLALEFSRWHLSIAILHYKFSLLNFFEALYQCWNNSFMWSLTTVCVSTKLICMKARSMPFCLWLHPRGRPWCLAHGSH